MAANNRGGMRPQGRSPPFLAVGLFVALCILGFNYWSMSSRNAELGNEITLLESEVRVLSAKKVSAEKRSESVLDKVKDLEDILKKERNNYGNKEAELAECNKNLHQKEEELIEVREEVENFKSVSSSCEENKKSLQAEIERLKAEVANQASAAQQAANACSESGCKQYVDQFRTKILDVLFKIYGLGIIQTLRGSGIDVGTYPNNAVQSNQPQGPNIPDPNAVIGHGHGDSHNPGGAPAPQGVIPSNPEKQQNELGPQPGVPGQPVANPVDTNQSNPNMNQPKANQANENQSNVGNQPGPKIIPSDKSEYKNPTFKFEQAPEAGKDPHSAHIENNTIENVKPKIGGQNKAANDKESWDKTGGDKDHKKDFDGEVSIL
ncbi:hypothetical protein CHS0354_010471 [Potamilus streckersoni]|uniref:Uncharacterized protein n=1 Tax=Potamilus streckersoni TaxID=2493646 RepID=A0AAE0RRP3_9BIVA|nr:hypothetical protein CHS0354_010471 [Potamilus streckersoni]